MDGTDTSAVRSAPGALGEGGRVAGNRWIVLAAVPLFLVLAGVVYLTVAFAQNERAEQGWVVHTYQVIDSLRAVLADAADAETGERGYLLTRKPSYLQPFRAAKLRTARDLDR